MIKSSVKDLLNLLNKAKRRINVHSIEDITKEINSLPINEGDSLFIHSALSSLGYFREDPDFIIKSLMKKIGKTGHLLMPAFSANGYSFEYLAKNPTFNVLETPSKMGILTEKFRLMQNVKRSIHPTHSVLAFGPEAEKICNSHHLDIKPFGKQSPFYKFLHLNNPKTLCIGTTIFPVTLFRVFETLNMDTYPLKVFLTEKFEVKYVDNHGNLGKLKTLAHNPEASEIRRNILFENELLNSGRLTKHKIGRSQSSLLQMNNWLHYMQESYDKGNLPYLNHYRDFNKNKVTESKLLIIKS